MTAEEARDRLKFEMSIMERDYEFDPEHDETYQALIVAVEALEKQIPKKWIPFEGNPYIEACPNCGGYIGIFGRPHCVRCSQAIDWGDEE